MNPNIYTKKQGFIIDSSKMFANQIECGDETRLFPGIGLKINTEKSNNHRDFLDKSHLLLP